MQLALEIRFLGLDAWPLVEAAAREKAAQLDQFRADLMSCRITIEDVHVARAPRPASPEVAWSPKTSA